MASHLARASTGSSALPAAAYTANVASGVLDGGISGGFAGGHRGVFYGADSWRGRPIIVRFVVDVVDAQTVRFEQSFSTNSGVDWEVNWIAVDKRM